MTVSRSSAPTVICLRCGEGPAGGTAPWTADRIDVGKDGNLYVVDSGNSRVQKFNSTGTFVGKWGSSGNSDGQFNGARGLCVDGSGNVYVADYGNNRIQKFASNGTSLPNGELWHGRGRLQGAFGGGRGRGATFMWSTATIIGYRNSPRMGSSRLNGEERVRPAAS